MRVDVSPAATEEEVAAIVAAVEALWPRAAAGATGADAPSAEQSPAWRFSGRWWSTPVPVRRDRPWWPA